MNIKREELKELFKGEGLMLAILEGLHIDKVIVFYDRAEWMITMDATTSVDDIKADFLETFEGKV